MTGWACYSSVVMDYSDDGGSLWATVRWFQRLWMAFLTGVLHIGIVLGWVIRWGWVALVAGATILVLVYGLPG